MPEYFTGFTDDDKEDLFELVENLKGKYGLKNIRIHYEDTPKIYWYLESKLQT